MLTFRTLRDLYRADNAIISSLPKLKCDVADNDKVPNEIRGKAAIILLELEAMGKELRKAARIEERKVTEEIGRTAITFGDTEMVW